MSAPRAASALLVKSLIYMAMIWLSGFIAGAQWGW